MKFCSSSTLFIRAQNASIPDIPHDLWHITRLHGALYRAIFGGGEMKCKHFTFVCPLHVRGSCLVHFGVASYIVYELQCNLQIAVPSLQGISYPLGMNFQNRTNLEIYTIKLTIIRSTFSFNKMQLCNSQNRIWRRKILLLEQENTTCAGYGKKKIRFRVLNPKFGTVSQTLTHKRP